jgi:hypothetical protein
MPRSAVANNREQFPYVKMISMNNAHIHIFTHLFYRVVAWEDVRAINRHSVVLCGFDVCVSEELLGWPFRNLLVYVRLQWGWDTVTVCSVRGPHTALIRGGRVQDCGKLRMHHASTNT